MKTKILFNEFLMWAAMSTSVLILSADFPHAMAAGHAEDFQIYV